jgi:hypothetical protein
MTVRSAAAAVLGLACCAVSLRAQGPADELERGFKNPPDAAKPRTWWHWTGGNVSLPGITKDLEWMKRAGIAGFQLADVSTGRGQTVAKKVEFGSPEWLEAVRHAASEANRLGLEMTIFSSPGWSITGGPWVKPAEAMKKLVWSETSVSGPRRFTNRLPQPPSNNGPIRNLAVGRAADAKPDPTHYADSVVLAYPTPAAEAVTTERPEVTTSAGAIDGSALLDDDLNSTVTVAAPAGGGPAWVQLTFANPFAARALTLAGPSGIPVGRVLASADGRSFETLVTLPGAQLYRQGRVRTFAFPEIRARVFRIEMTGAPLNPAATMSQAPPQPAAQYVLAEAIVHVGARVHRAEEKAGFSFLFEYESVPTPDVTADAAIRRADVVDLTSRMAADGSLDWAVPPGRWTILRLGHSLTGAKNRPAMPTGLGYEADKLSRTHMEAYLRGYLDPIAASLGPLFGKALSHVLIDSWEAGTQNWTDEMLREFQARRGYDARPYLPALLGRVVESASVSDRFLWDFRRTLADMWADHHYGSLHELLKQRGLGTYSEASGVSLEIPEDTLLNKSKVDIPMGEFWVRDLHPRLMYFQDVRGAASASHAYGKRLVAAESFTGGGYESPFALKKVGDYWLAQGINRIVFHTSAHQPEDSNPGNTMVGTHLHRNITWAEQAAPFTTYLARSSFLLQQGLFVADVAYLLNEGAPSTMPIWGAGLQPKPPDGHDYDFVNADVVLHRMSVDASGRLLLPDGMSYRLLVLPQVESMRPELLRKLRELVAGGATVLGPRPAQSPGLAGQPASDREVRALAAELWGDLDGASRTVRQYGKGRVAWGLSLQETLRWLGIAKDFDSSRGLDGELAWIHRRTGDVDIYYVANLTDRAQEIAARFRVLGREAEIWRPDTGAIEPAGHTLEKEGTVVPLELQEREAVFVVFRRAATTPLRARPSATTSTLTTLNGPWDVRFQPGLGAPATLPLARLESWTANADPGVKHFSGTATYVQSLRLRDEWLRPNARILLDLGRVGDLAQVTLNGRPLGTLWKPPYQVDATAALRRGENRLEIAVTNQWTNRLLGDRLEPAEKKVLGSSGVNPGGIGAGPNPAPPESGLLGPVRLLSRIP